LPGIAKGYDVINLNIITRCLSAPKLNIMPRIWVVEQTAYDLALFISHNIHKVTMQYNISRVAAAYRLPAVTELTSAVVCFWGTTFDLKALKRISRLPNRRLSLYLLRQSLLPQIRRL
jgi:hypothetical protein